MLKRMCVNDRERVCSVFWAQATRKCAYIYMCVFLALPFSGRFRLGCVCLCVCKVCVCMCGWLVVVHLGGPALLFEDAFFWTYVHDSKFCVDLLFEIVFLEFG